MSERQDHGERGNSRSDQNPRRSSRSRRSGRAQNRRTKPLPPMRDVPLPPHLFSTLDETTYIVFDIETTGGNPDRNGITEICALKIQNDAIVDRFYSMVNPGIPIPPIVRRMTGIDNRMVRDAPPIQDVMPAFCEFIGDGILVSHNTVGDMKFLKYFSAKTAKREIDNYFLCTHLLVDKLFPEAEEKSLKGLVRHFDLVSGDLHRAEADAQATFLLFRLLLAKIKQKQIVTVDQAIRFQGEMESALQLGWGISKEALEKIPSSPGIFYMFDRERRVLFLSSAANLQREVKKLQKYAQVPRHILKLVLRAHDVQTERYESTLSALLAERDALKKVKVSADPSAWHRRSVDALFIAHEQDHLRIGVGPLEAGARAAFGPVKDHKMAQQILEKISAAFATPLYRRGLILLPAWERVLVSFFKGELKKDRKVMKTGKFRLTHLWRREQRQQAQKDREVFDKLLQIALPTQWQPLMESSGLAVVPHTGSGEWEVFSVARSTPRGSTIVQGDCNLKFQQGGFGQRLHDSITVLRDAAPSQHGLNVDDAARTSAFLWWLFHDTRRDDERAGRFITLDELKQICASSEAVK